MNFISTLRSWLDFLKLYPDQGVFYEFWFLVIVSFKVFFFSLALSYVYKKQVDKFSSYFYHAKSFFFLILGLAIIIIIINRNIMGAFSLIGALSLIRFRAVMKSSLDTAFYFLALVAGVSIPFQMSWIAWVSLICIGLFLKLYSSLLIKPKKKERKLIRITHTGEIEKILAALQLYTPKLKSSRLSSQGLVSLVALENSSDVINMTNIEGVSSLEFL